MSELHIILAAFEHIPGTVKLINDIVKIRADAFGILTEEYRYLLDLDPSDIRIFKSGQEADA